MGSIIAKILVGLAPPLQLLAKTQTIVSMVVIAFFAIVNFNTWALPPFGAQIESSPPSLHDLFTI